MQKTNSSAKAPKPVASAKKKHETKSSRALAAIEVKKNSILYKKSPAGKFVPATDPWAYDGLSNGWWLIKVQPSSTSIRQCLHPDRAELDAARRDAEEKIVNILTHCLKAHPKVSQIKPEFARAWKQLEKKHGHEMLLLEYPSLYEAAEKILSELFSIHTSQHALQQASPPPNKFTEPEHDIWQ